MIDWPDPAAWESGAKALAAIVDALIKLSDRISRRKASAAGGTRKLDEELDELQADLQQLVDLLTRYMEKQADLSEAQLHLLRTLYDPTSPDGGTGLSILKAHAKLLKSTAEAAQGLQTAVMAQEQRLRALEGKHAAKALKTKRQRKRSG
jgi:DNA repair exonuclease SbcCD ATPase subunit